MALCESSGFIFQNCIVAQLRALLDLDPEVVIGRGFGGFVVMELIRKGLWTGPTLLVAPAAVPGVDDLNLSPGTPILIVAAKHDTRGLSALKVAQRILKSNHSDPSGNELSDTSPDLSGIVVHGARTGPLMTGRCTV